jgi:ribosomal protein L11 methylase PrmA
MGIVVQIRFPKVNLVNIPVNLCTGIPWQIVDSPSGMLTFVTRKPIKHWDYCLKELQNWVCKHIPEDIQADTEWEVMSLERYNFLKDKKSVPVGQSWTAILNPFSIPIKKRHMAWKEKTIFLKPGWAFGDGCHPSTQGSVDALQYLHNLKLVRDKHVLDIGTGTGILGIIAGKMGAQSVLCLDIDPEAIRVTRENIKENGLEAIASVAHGTVYDLLPGKWNVALANLTISIIIRIFGTIVDLLNVPRILVISGFKSNNYKEVAKLIQSYGFEVMWSKEQDGWMTLIIKQN